MAFRTLEITEQSEIHIINSQIQVQQHEESYLIPIEDLYHITAIGANIRMSTMDLSILSENNVTIVTF